MVNQMEVAVSCTGAGGCVAPCQTVPEACGVACGGGCGGACSTACATGGGVLLAGAAATSLGAVAAGGVSTSALSNKVACQVGIDMVVESVAITFFSWWYS